MLGLMVRAYVVSLAAGAVACASGRPETFPIEEAPLELAKPCRVTLEPDMRPVVWLRLGVGPPLRFLVDSGSTITLLDARRADELGLERWDFAGSFETSGATGKSITLSHYVAVERLELGELVVHSPRLTLMDDPVLQQSGVDGIIGQDLLARLALVIDAERDTLHLLPQGGAAAVQAYLEKADVGAGAWGHVPLEFRPCPFLSLDMPGVSQVVELELDTGAEFSSLPRAALAALGLEPIGQRVSTGVGGSHTSDTYRIQDLNLFGLSIEVVVCESATEFGLLGMDVLGEFVVVLDGPEQTLWLHHRE